MRFWETNPIPNGGAIDAIVREVHQLARIVSVEGQRADLVFGRETIPVDDDTTILLDFVAGDEMTDEVEIGDVAGCDVDIWLVDECRVNGRLVLFEFSFDGSLREEVVDPEEEVVGGQRKEKSARGEIGNGRQVQPKKNFRSGLRLGFTSTRSPSISRNPFRRG